MIGKTKEEQCGVSGYILLAMLFSFLGWALETLFVRMTSGVWTKRGFLSLPICPIYGVCVLVTYALIGLPQKGNGRWKKCPLNTALYALFCFLIPSLTELSVGWILDKKYHVKLWTYSAWKYNLCGYVCLPISLCWAGLLFLIMRYVFPAFRLRIGRLPRPLKRVLATLFTVLTLCDGVARFIQMTGAGLR